MYKLLLVSDKEEIRSLYRRYAEWNTLGFEQPDVAENAQQGIDLLSHRRYDAISSLLSVSEGKKFFAYLSRRPEMLGMETARDEAHLRREISTARRALSTRDASRQSKQVDDYTKALQGEFFCDLLRGAAFDCTKIDERMQSLKLDALDAAANNFAATDDTGNIWYTWEVLGYPFSLVDAYTLGQLEQRDDVQAMPAFPAQDCCQMIDGTLVVKLSAI